MVIQSTLQTSPSLIRVKRLILRGPRVRSACCMQFTKELYVKAGSGVLRDTQQHKGANNG